MADNIRAQKLYQLFKDHLTKNNFHYEAHDAEMVITLTVHGEDLPQPTIIRVMADRNVVQILSPIPSRIPEDKRMDAAVAVCVANYGMINGAFDLDMSDGEIRYRVAQGFHDTELSEEMVRYMLQIVFFTTDKYNDRFFMLGKGMMTLEDFIAKEGKN